MTTFDSCTLEVVADATPPAPKGVQAYSEHSPGVLGHSQVDLGVLHLCW